MRPVVHVVRDAAAGLARERDLMNGDAPGLCLWSAERVGLVCPENLSRRPGFSCATARAEATGWPVHRRPTGGGVVPQGPGILNIAMAVTLPRGLTITSGYRLITWPIATVLAREGIVAQTGATAGSFCDGDWNLSIAGRKVVGTAQRWRPLPDGRMRVLAHALILMSGRVGPGVEAVNAFQRDLGIDAPVRATAHTTLETAMGRTPSEVAVLAIAFHNAAQRELARAGPPFPDRAAA